MRHVFRIISLGLMAAIAVGGSGCVWGPCGPAFKHSASSKEAEMQQMAEKIKDASAARPQVGSGR
jgi:hypothetical protein